MTYWKKGCISNNYSSRRALEVQRCHLDDMSHQISKRYPFGPRTVCEATLAPDIDAATAMVPLMLRFHRQRQWSSFRSRLCPAYGPSTATGSVEISRVNAFWWCGPARKVKTTTEDDGVRRPIQSLRRSQPAHWPRGLGAQDRKPSSHTTCQHPSRRHLAKGKGPRPATASPGPKGPLSRVGLVLQQSKLGQAMR